MKKYLFLCIIAVSAFGKLASQTNNDCVNAILLCSNPSFTFNATANDGNVDDIPTGNTVSNPQTNVEPGNSGCLMQGENNPQWLLISVGNAGVLEFVFGAGNSANPQAGYYDWAMWPYSAATCGAIQNNTLPPIRCNWNGSSTGGTGLASATTISNLNTNPANAQAQPSNFQTPLTVNPCDQFIICISNFSNVNTLVSFLSLGSASLSCAPSCANYNLCAGNSATISPVNFANLSNPTYSLNPGGISNNTGQFVVSPLTSTNYTTYITGLNGLNSVQTITSITSVVVNPKPIVAPTFTQTTCTNTLNGLNLHLSFVPASPAPNYTVSWSTVPNNISTSTQFSATNIGAGTYISTVTAQGGCTATSTITITPTPPQANFTLTPLGSTFSVTCAQPSLVIDATNPALNYTWTNGSSAPFNDPQALFTTSNLGSWTISAINPISNCTASHVFTVGQNFVAPTSTVSPTLQNITCLTAGQTVSATANPTSNITHYFSAPAGATVAINSYTAIYVPGGPGTYTHCLVNNLNGCSTCKNFTVTSSDNFPLLTVVSANNFTLGCGTHSTAAITLSGAAVPNSAGAVTYTLLPPPSPPATYGFGGSLQYVVSTPGMWTAVVKDLSNQCQTKVPFSVILDNLGPDIGADVPVSVLSCDVPSTVITATTAYGHSAFSWVYPGPSGTVTTINPTLAVTTTTNTNSPLVANYTLSIQNLDNGCFSTLVVPIKQNLFAPRPIIGGNFTITCKTQTVGLTNGSLINPLVGASGYPVDQPIIAVLWEGPSPQTPAPLSANYVGAVPGPYTLTVKDLNNGCTAKTSSLVTDNRIYPVVNIPQPPSDTLDCGNVNKKITVVITGTTTNLSYQWITPPNTPPVGATNTRSLTVYLPGKYRVVVTNTLNGCATLGYQDVIPGELSALFTPDHTSGYAPLNVTFANNSHSAYNSTSSITTVWSFGNGTQSTTTLAAIDANAVYTQPGTYTVTMYASKGACQDTAVRIIHVDIPSKLDIPNVFTPNGDGINDLFFLKVANLDEITASIFDRWGHKVYELTSNTGNIAWDGKTETGKEAAAGVYFYIIKATGKDGNSYDTKGTVTLYK